MTEAMVDAFRKRLNDEEARHKQASTPLRAQELTGEVCLAFCAVSVTLKALLCLRG
jgi:hypothetical protein